MAEFRTPYSRVGTLDLRPSLISGAADGPHKVGGRNSIPRL